MVVLRAVPILRAGRADGGCQRQRLERSSRPERGAARPLGGEEEDFDVIHHPTFFGEDYTMVDGDPLTWETARNLLNRGINSAEDYNNISNLIDIDNLIDHFIVRTWSADYDWLSPIERNDANVSVFDNKNWYSGGKSRGES